VDVHVAAPYQTLLLDKNVSAVSCIVNAGHVRTQQPGHDYTQILFFEISRHVISAFQAQIGKYLRRHDDQRRIKCVLQDVCKPFLDILNVSLRQRGACDETSMSWPGSLLGAGYMTSLEASSLACESKDEASALSKTHRADARNNVVTHELAHLTIAIPFSRTMAFAQRRHSVTSLDSRAMSLPCRTIRYMLCSGSYLYCAAAVYGKMQNYQVIVKPASCVIVKFMAGFEPNKRFGHRSPGTKGRL
jgi:hypothetical protein